MYLDIFINRFQLDTISETIKEFSGIDARENAELPDKLCIFTRFSWAKSHGFSRSKSDIRVINTQVLQGEAYEKSAIIHMKFHFLTVLFVCFHIRISCNLFYCTKNRDFSAQFFE